MIKKIIFIITSLLIISCGSQRKVVTKKPTTTKPTTTKPVVKTQNPKPKTTNTNDKTEVLKATTQVKVTTKMVLDYIDQFKNEAKNDMQQYGIPASITLAQGILESGAGTGPLAIQGNNHFGIKCHKEWVGDSILHDDDALQECFRKYTNPNHSYRDHSLFLTSRSRYAPLFQLDKSDYKAWAKGLKEAGYATDVKYSEKLISLIERYQLHQYDNEVLGKITPTTTTTHTVEKGDTLYNISKRYNINIDDLKKKNNITENGISIGQILIVN